jgi:hypothetical protein
MCYAASLRTQDSVVQTNVTFSYDGWMVKRALLLQVEVERSFFSRKEHVENVLSTARRTAMMGDHAQRT